jgi:D-alanine-D-alanine ligase
LKSVSERGGPTGVGVLFGGPSPEHDVSILTGLQAARALQGAGRTEAVYWTKAGAFVLVDAGLEARDFLEGPPKGARELRFAAQPGGGFSMTGKGLFAGERRLELDAVVNCCHGGPGEDGTLQAALDLAEVAYTGPAAAAAALGMDKLGFGGVVRCAGLPALPRELVVPGAEQPRWEGFEGPYIVKPRFGGSSIGIEVIERWADVARFASLGGPHASRGMVVEPYQEGALDVEVAMRAYPQMELSLFAKALRAGEPGKAPAKGAILSYSDKYLGGEGMLSAPRELPAELPPGLEKELAGAATAVAALVGLRGVWRVDFLVESGGRWWVNEVNTVPGSLAKYLWVGAAERPFARLLTDMVEEARARPSARFTTAGADGTALRSAAAIASKLSQ